MNVFVARGVYIHNSYAMMVVVSGYYELTEEQSNCIKAAMSESKEKNDE